MRFPLIISLLGLSIIMFFVAGCPKGSSTSDSDDLWYKAKIENAIREGEDLNVSPETNRSGRTFLHEAALGDYIESVKLLLKNGVDVDPLDDTESTPLHLAAQKGSLQAAKLLIEHGADIEAKDDISETPLSRSMFAKVNKAAILNLLINTGADVNNIDRLGNTPINWAAFYGNVEAIEVLLSKGLDINAQDKHGVTGLHIAALRGHYKAVRILLENGADVTIRTELGRTPLASALEPMESKYASQSGKRKAAKLIRAKGGQE